MVFKCCLNKMLFKFKRIVGCIEPWVKNRDTNRIVSLCIVTALVHIHRYTHLNNNIMKTSTTILWIHYDCETVKCWISVFIHGPNWVFQLLAFDAGSREISLERFILLIKICIYRYIRTIFPVERYLATIFAMATFFLPSARRR